MKGLNKEQRKAASFISGIAAVIAVPGSGKTLTMMERIGFLVTQHNVPPENILGLTFTRNAAEEMRQRLVPVLQELASRVTLSTIHSFCHYLLRNEGKLFEILSGKDQLSFIKSLGGRKLAASEYLTSAEIVKALAYPQPQHRWRHQPVL